MPLRTLSELDDGPSGFGGNSDSDDDTRSLSEHSQLSLSQQSSRSMSQLSSVAAFNPVPLPSGGGLGGNKKKGGKKKKSKKKLTLRGGERALGRQRQGRRQGGQRLASSSPSRSSNSKLTKQVEQLQLAVRNRDRLLADRDTKIGTLEQRLADAESTRRHLVQNNAARLLQVAKLEKDLDSSGTSSG